MEMTIKTMTIKDFKGIKSLTLDLDGHSASIAGRNGTGKTSVCDAFLWLLFGKDSAGKAADVKPLDRDGERVSGLESEVVATLTVEGKDVELRRQWHEVWSKDPESGEKVYSRDETLCWVDGVPKKLEKEYIPYILSLVGGDENTFKLISERGAFMRMGWNDRRKELVKIAGGDADEEIRRDPSFADIERVLAGVSAEDAKKRLLDQRKRLDQELKAIPERIDELEKTLRPLDESELSAAQAALDDLNAQLADVNAQLTPSQESIQRMNGLYAQRRELENKLRDIEDAARKPIREALAAAEGKLAGYRSAAASLHADALAYESRLNRANADLDKLKQRRESMLAEYHNYANMVYAPPEIATTCPTCGQSLPQDKLGEVARKHREEWEQKRNALMETVKNNGKSVALQINELQDEVENAQASLNSAKANMEGQRTPIELEEEAKRLRGTEVSVGDIPEWQEAKGQLDAVNHDIESQSDDSRRVELMKRRADIESGMKGHNAVLALRETNDRVKARMVELNEQKRTVGAKAASVEGDIALLSQYARARCTALETAINRRFYSIKWRMFDTAKNGNMIDCCDAMVGGVAYSVDSHKLNAGACFNADIEIINVLSRAYGVSVPCFIDEGERVDSGKLAYPGGQRIEMRREDGVDCLTVTIDEP
ncbi:MAG: AAA family ATPase [Clostridia bacterium]